MYRTHSMSWDAPLRLCQCKCKRFLGRGGSESERALLGSGEEGKVGGTEGVREEMHEVGQGEEISVMVMKAVAEQGDRNNSFEK